MLHQTHRLAQHDPPLALKNTGVLNRQSLGGALATGTHGTGVKFPIMSDAVRIMLCMMDPCRLKNHNDDN